MYSSIFSLVAIGFLATGVQAQAEPKTAPAAVSANEPSEAAGVEADTAEADVEVIAVKPPADLENDNSGDYMKHMTPAELERLYARHDAEVARLMAAAPDDDLFGVYSLIDPLTGEKVSIDLVAF